MSVLIKDTAPISFAKLLILVRVSEPRSMESKIPRNGDPGHYVSLFAYDEDGVIKYPS